MKNSLVKTIGNHLVLSNIYKDIIDHCDNIYNDHNDAWYTKVDRMCQEYCKSA